MLLELIYLREGKFTKCEELVCESHMFEPIHLNTIEFSKCLTMGSKMYAKKWYFFETSQHKTQFSCDQKLDSWRLLTILVNLDFNIKKPYDSHHGNPLQAFQFICKIVGNHIPQLFI